MTLRHLDLFSGIGGFALGLERSGLSKPARFCEIDPYCRKVLAKHWPGVPIHDDITTMEFQEGEADIITGGFPCQDLSYAGRGAGLSGERSGLYRELVRAVRVVRPEYVLVENVAALLSRGLGTVLADLAEVGYDAEWHCIPAGNLGAPHERDRLWIVAHTNDAGLEGLWCTIRDAQKIANPSGKVTRSNAEAIARLYSLQHGGLRPVINGVAHGPAWGGQQWPETEPLLCRVDDGIPNRVGRTAALGNAVVPQIPELIGRALLSARPKTREQRVNG